MNMPHDLGWKPKSDHLERDYFDSRRVIAIVDFKLICTSLARCKDPGVRRNLFLTASVRCKVMSCNICFKLSTHVSEAFQKCDR